MSPDGQMRRVTRLAGALLALAGVAVVAGCGDDDERVVSAGGRAFEEGIPWVLASGLAAPGAERRTPSATFADGTVAGLAGCNRFRGSYTVDGSALEIGTIASTQMACSDEADAVEREYLAALERVAEWRGDAAEMTLADRDGNELLRFRHASPVGAWVATGLLQGDAVSSPLPGTEITAAFDQDGTLPARPAATPIARPTRPTAAR
jgi:heat shock protein HslJ